MGAAVLALGPATAHAQLDDRTVVSVMRECRKLEDLTARVACYDNIPLGQAPSTVREVPSGAQAPRGFGSDQLRRPAAERASEPREVVSTVAGAVEREPGVFVLTLEDGAQWQFVDAVSTAYDPPFAGSTIRIISASLGSYLMRYADQRGVRVRRIR